MGGLATILAGDFLQLPPVDRPSLARPIVPAGSLDEERGETVGAEDSVAPTTEADAKKRGCKKEGKRGKRRG